LAANLLVNGDARGELVDRESTGESDVPVEMPADEAVSTAVVASSLSVADSEAGLEWELELALDVLEVLDVASVKG
jgi:hypothetical protein